MPTATSNGQVCLSDFFSLFAFSSHAWDCTMFLSESGPFSLAPLLSLALWLGYIVHVRENPHNDSCALQTALDRVPPGAAFERRPAAQTRLDWLVVADRRFHTMCPHAELMSGGEKQRAVTLLPRIATTQPGRAIRRQTFHSISGYGFVSVPCRPRVQISSTFSAQSSKSID